MDLSPLDRAIRAARRGHEAAARRLLDAVLADEPDNEIAVVWRARVSSEPGVRVHFLQRALDLNPQNRWASDALAALGDVEPAAPGSGSGLDAVTERVETIHHVQCPSCGGQVEVHPERGTKAAVCTHCGSVLDLTTKQLEILGRTKPKLRPRVPIEPGAEATFDGERHLVIGWLRYKGWDDEESWTWDEWQLVSDSGRARYLSYSPDEGFVLQTPIHPTPRVTRSGIELPDGNVSFAETSPAQITAVRGELTWRPRLDETLRVGEADRGDQQYSVELTASEVEVVGGPALTDREVWQAFGRDDLVAESEAAQARAARLRRLSIPCWLAVGMLILAAIVAGTAGETVLSSDVALEQAAVGGGPVGSAGGRPAVAGTFGAEAGETVEVTVRATFPGSNDWTAPDVYVTAPGGARHYLFTPDLWTEGGESDRTASRVFEAPAAGTYTVDLELIESNRSTASVHVEVQTGVWLVRYYLFAAALAGLLGAALLVAGGSGRPSY